MLTHPLLKISNILLRQAIYCSIFTCHDFRKEKYFIPFFFFFLHFLNLGSILNIFKKGRRSSLMYLSTYILRKTWLDKCLRSLVSEDSSTSNMINTPKHCSKLDDSTFTIFIDPSKTIQIWKVPLSYLLNLRTIF